MGTDAQGIKLYHERVRREFTSLKSIRRYNEVIARSIPLADDIGYLACVSELHADDDTVIALFAQWRDEATTWHNRFKVTFEGTKSWTRRLLLDVPDRILFLVLNRWGHPVGHLGFAHALSDDGKIEFDNVVRGVPNAAPGIMSAATNAILGWAQQSLQPSGFYLRTLESNTHAIKFYERLNFKIGDKQPLRRVQKNNDDFDHLPIEEGDTRPPDCYFVRMNYEP